MRSFLGALLASCALLGGADARENRLHRHAVKRLADSRALVPLGHWSAADPVNKLYFMIEGGANIPLFPTPCTGLVYCLSATFLGSLKGTLATEATKSSLEMEGVVSATILMDAVAVLHLSATLEGSIAIEATCTKYTQSKPDEPLAVDQEFGWSALSSFLIQMLGSDQDIIAFGKLEASHQTAWKAAGDEAICAAEALQKAADAKKAGRRLLSDELGEAEQHVDAMNGMEVYHHLAADEQAQILAKVTAGMTDREIIELQLKNLEIQLKIVYFAFMAEVTANWNTIFKSSSDPFNNWDMTAADETTTDKKYAQDQWVATVMTTFHKHFLQPQRTTEYNTWMTKKPDGTYKDTTLITTKGNKINCEPGALNFGSGKAGTSINIMMCRFLKTAFLKSVSASGVDQVTLIAGFKSMFPMLTHSNPDYVSQWIETKEVADKFTLLYQCPDEFKKGMTEYKAAAEAEVIRDKCWVSKLTGRIKLNFGFSFGFSTLGSIGATTGMYGQLVAERSTKEDKFTWGDETGLFAVVGASAAVGGMSFAVENKWRALPRPLKFESSTYSFCQDCSAMFDNAKVKAGGAAAAKTALTALDQLLRADTVVAGADSANALTKAYNNAKKFMEWFYGPEGVAFHKALGLDSCYPEDKAGGKLAAVKKFVPGSVGGLASLVQDISAVVLEGAKGLGQTPFASVNYEGKHCVEIELGETAAGSSLGVSLTKKVTLGGGTVTLAPGGLVGGTESPPGGPGDTLGFLSIEQGSVYEFGA